ncbi:MAG: cupin domain-containing protein [Acidimicrobiales bacterium]|nr:cupin domain-containing protein [Acidimicrobiales bacterium]
MTPSLEGWDITQAADVEWVAWGEAGDARAKVLGSADGYLVALVEAQAGYAGTYHEHAHAEFLYVLAGTLRNQGRTMQAGDAYAAAAGSVHSDFAAESDATYLSIFKL